jgi:hypothetical protein
MNTANYCFKVKNKNVTMLHNSKQELSLRKDVIFIFVPLKLLGQLDSSFAKIILW